MINKLFSIMAIFCITILIGILTLEHGAFARDRHQTIYRNIKYVYQILVHNQIEAFCNLPADIILGGGASCPPGTQLDHSKVWIGAAEPTKWVAKCVDETGEYWTPESIIITCGTNIKIILPPPPILPPRFDEME